MWHRGVAECATDVLTSSVICYWTDARQHGIYLLYIITKSHFYFKIFQHNAKAGLCPALAHFGEDEKKPFDVICYLYKIKQFYSKQLWLVEENHATVKPDSSVAPRGMKTYSESRIKLRNLKILKKMLEKSSQFLPSRQPCGLKSLDVALKIAGVEKIPSENLWLWSA